MISYIEICENEYFIIKNHKSFFQNRIFKYLNYLNSIQIQCFKVSNSICLLLRGMFIFANFNFLNVK